MEIDCSRTLPWIEALGAAVGEKITITPLLIKAVSRVFAQMPELNVLIRGNRLYQRESVDIFVQVFTEEDAKPDLSGAKIRNAHLKPVADIAAELREQAKRIRSGDDPNLKQSKRFLRHFPFWLVKKTLRFLAWINFDLNVRPKFLGLPPNPFGVAMITNVGMFGLEEAWAPLVPFSRSPIVMTIGRIIETPVVRDGAIVARPIMKIGMTVDHRIIDGFLAGKAAKILREGIENPESFDGESQSEMD